jgi:hypothetical protein
MYTDISSIPITELTSAGILVFILQQAKRFSLLGGLGSWTYRIISILWALVSTIIVSMEWSGNLANGGTLILVLPGLGGALVALWHWISQYATQEIVYQATAARMPAPAPELAAEPEAGRSAGYLPPQASGSIAPSGSSRKQ